MRNSYTEIIDAIDVKAMEKAAGEVQFAQSTAPELVQLSRLEDRRMLVTAEKRLAAGDPKGAQELAQQALDKKIGDEGRALFILAQVAVANKNREGAAENFQKAIQSTNDPKVVALVYVAAFAPDKGESVSTLIQNPAPGAPVPPILPPQDGYLFLDRAKFRASFAADVNAETAAFMADSQVPWGLGAISGAISEPAWRTTPSWYLVTTEDKMILPDTQACYVQARGCYGR